MCVVVCDVCGSWGRVCVCEWQCDPNHWVPATGREFNCAVTGVGTVGLLLGVDFCVVAPRWTFADIHPPLGKLTIALYSHLRGYKAGICSYQSNTMYSPNCQYYIPVSTPW
jgi:hypothetical protein